MLKILGGHAPLATLLPVSVSIFVGYVLVAAIHLFCKYTTYDA